MEPMQTQTEPMNTMPPHTEHGTPMAMNEEVQWEFEKYTGCWKRLMPEFEDALNAALRQGHDVVLYQWPWPTGNGNEVVTTHYEFDIKLMIQTNLSTKFKRGIRRIIVLQ